MRDPELAQAALERWREFAGPETHPQYDVIGDCPAPVVPEKVAEVRRDTGMPAMDTIGDCPAPDVD